MLRTKKIILAAIVMMMSLTIFTGCVRGEDKTKYLHLKTDIVGAWCDEAGPEEVETQAGTAHRFYEFTEDGAVFYYFAYDDIGAAYTESSYTIDGNIFDSEGSKCRINVENDILTMTFNEGSSRYRRVGAAELLEYSVYAQGKALFAEQEPLIMAKQGVGDDVGTEEADEMTDASDVSDVSDMTDNSEVGTEDEAEE
ncbi:MAG: hypothetical protein K2K57_04065 [Oscillospiraceae bacterium]|nr:hypothetical protein [Oscillospiraceae bacterium]